MNPREISIKQIRAGEARAKALLDHYSKAELRDLIREFIRDCALNPDELGVQAATSFIEDMYSEGVDLSICNLVGSSRDPEAMTTIVRAFETKGISDFIHVLRRFAQRLPDMFAPPSPVGSDEELTEAITAAPVVPASDEVSSLASALRRDSESSGENSFGAASSVKDIDNTIHTGDIHCDHAPSDTMAVLGELV